MICQGAFLCCQPACDMSPCIARQTWWEKQLLPEATRRFWFSMDMWWPEMSSDDVPTLYLLLWPIRVMKGYVQSHALGSHWTHHRTGLLFPSLCVGWPLTSRCLSNHKTKRPCKPFKPNKYNVPKLEALNSEWHQAKTLNEQNPAVAEYWEWKMRIEGRQNVILHVYCTLHIFVMRTVDF